MPEIIVQPPAGECIHLDEAKLHLRVTETSQDLLIKGLLSGARQAAETKTRQQLLHAQWKLVLDKFPMAGSGTPLPFSDTVNIPGYAVRLPHAPVVNVVSIKYLDMGEIQQTMDPADYTTNTAMMPGIISPRFGRIWPIALPQIGAIEIVYNAGYASPFKRNANNIVVIGPVTWAVGAIVQFYASGGTLPTPLQELTNYKIASALNGTYAITDMNDVPIALTDAGTGSSFIGVVPEGLRNWIKIRMASLYENREEVAILNRGSIQELPFIDGLLDPYRISLP